MKMKRLHSTGTGTLLVRSGRLLHVTELKEFTHTKATLEMLMMKATHASIH